jgi:hypothetical protein
MEELINVFRDKLTEAIPRLSSLELNALEDVYFYYTEKVNGRGRVLNKTCHPCIKDALKIVNNNLAIEKYESEKNLPSEGLLSSEPKPEPDILTDEEVIEAFSDVDYVRGPRVKPEMTQIESFETLVKPTRKEYIYLLKGLGVKIPRNAKHETLKQLYYESI